jgi:hypothetical protein
VKWYYASENNIEIDSKFKFTVSRKIFFMSELSLTSNLQRSCVLIEFLIENLLLI